MKYPSQVEHHPSGDIIIPISPELVAAMKLHPGDILWPEKAADGELILRLAVRFSRFRRELNKYQRRIASGQSFLVIRCNRPVAEIGKPKIKQAIT